MSTTTPLSDYDQHKLANPYGTSCGEGHSLTRSRFERAHDDLKTFQAALKRTSFKCEYECQTPDDSVDLTLSLKIDQRDVGTAMLRCVLILAQQVMEANFKPDTLCRMVAADVARLAGRMSK